MDDIDPRMERHNTYRYTYIPGESNNKGALRSLAAVVLVLSSVLKVNCAAIFSSCSSGSHVVTPAVSRKSPSVACGVKNADSSPSYTHIPCTINM
jgi:CRISPR/Cas system CSM-associated protein Csm3 (group 7 of RAMP superfamily)